MIKDPCFVDMPLSWRRNQIGKLVDDRFETPQATARIADVAKDILAWLEGLSQFLNIWLEKLDPDLPDDESDLLYFAELKRRGFTEDEADAWSNGWIAELGSGERKHLDLVSLEAGWLT